MSKEALERVLDDLIRRRNEAQAEADARVARIVQLTGLGYEPESFDMDGLDREVNGFKAAHYQHLTLAGAIRELQRRA